MHRVALPLVALALAVSLALAASAASGSPGSLPLPGFARAGSGPSGGLVASGVIPGSTGRPSLVYLPPGFPKNAPYPVVYLLHGMPGNPWEYVNSLRLAATADGLISHGQARPFIAVLPVAGDTQRYNGEWTGPWETYVVDSVVPWVDAHLPTIASPAGRVLAGLSAGGYGAIDIGLRHPRLFGTLESWSGYFVPFRDGTLTRLSDRALAAYTPTLLVKAKASALRAAGTRFVLSTGPSHGHTWTHFIDSRQTIAFAQELSSLGLPHSLWIVKARAEYYPQLLHGLLTAFGTKTTKP